MVSHKPGLMSRYSIGKSVRKPMAAVSIVPGPDKYAIDPYVTSGFHTKRCSIGDVFAKSKKNLDMKKFAGYNILNGSSVYNG